MHVHAASARADHRRRLTWTLLLAASYLVAEVIGGLWTGSLALLADAGHMASDVAALGVSLFALWLADRPAPLERTFGYRRAEVLAALGNGVALFVVAFFIVGEAIERFRNPSPVLGGPMILIAFGGLLVNLAGLWILGGGRHESLNVRGAWLHVLSDTLGSVGAVTAGALIWGFGWTWADPAASLAIALLIVRASWLLVRETVDVLMEAAPPGIDVAEVRASLEEVAGVASVHDLHVWTITSGMMSLSCHVTPSVEANDTTLLADLRDVLAKRFGIEHVTIQIEPEGFDDSSC